MSHAKVKAKPVARSPGDPVYVIEPRPEHGHTHSVILLHGLGSNGEKFGSELLRTGQTSAGRGLAEVLPGARFIFPTARRRRSSAFNRSMLTQWFDVADVSDSSFRRETQLQGLEESAHEVLAILAAELDKVPPQNVILGGLSQGCAMSLAVLLSLTHPLGGFVGMCGFMAYRDDLEIALEEHDYGDDDPFSTGGASKTGAHPSVRAQAFQRDLLCLSGAEDAEPATEATSRLTPVFLGHGSVDEKVPLAQALAMAQATRSAGYEVTWRCYEGLGHWYKVPEEMDDLVEFIGSRVGWKTVV